LTISLAKKVTNRLHFYFHKLIPAWLYPWDIVLLENRELHSW
jgi:hypothetical protein